jgi:hypothetical protein
MFHVLLAILLVCGMSLPSQAAQVTVNLVATVTNVMDAHGFLGGRIHPGDQVTGTYTYDPSATTDGFPAIPSYGVYHFTAAPVGFQVAINGAHFASAQNPADFTVYVSNGAIDFLGFYSFTNVFDVDAVLPSFPSDASTLQNIIAWALRDDTHTALTNDALPLLAPVPNAFEDVNNLVIQSVALHAYYNISAHVDQAFIGDAPRRRRGGR